MKGLLTKATSASITKCGNTAASLTTSSSSRSFSASLTKPSRTTISSSTESLPFTYYGFNTTRHFASKPAGKDAKEAPKDDKKGGDAAAAAAPKKPAEPQIKLDPKIEKLIDEMMRLNVYEMKTFIEAVSKKLGVPDSVFMNPLTSNPYPAPSGMQFAASQGGAVPTGAAPAAGGAAQAAAAKAAEKPAEKSTFKVKLVKADEGVKYKVLKEIKALKPGMGIVELKKYIENLPQILKEDATKEEAEKWQKQIKEAGGEVSLE
eukprot:TRINITY_DN1434_c0_g1_i1.p1 TRINITY_DN1434_c0_g1~~TRINITY_DN1434_c0_g1_i1.p1  ORF type:complete len:262 (-),score=82.30 TRINITY_DN1434_c0_g1_i1:224-1009(-)